jgi:hypothetical protein
LLVLTCCLFNFYNAERSLSGFLAYHHRILQAAEENPQNNIMASDNAQPHSSSPSTPTHTNPSTSQDPPSNTNATEDPEPDPYAPSSLDSQRHMKSYTISEILALPQDVQNELSGELSVACWKPFTVRAICTPSSAYSDVMEIPESAYEPLPDDDDGEEDGKSKNGQIKWDLKRSGEKVGKRMGAKDFGVRVGRKDARGMGLREGTGGMR